MGYVNDQEEEEYDNEDEDEEEDDYDEDQDDNEEEDDSNDEDDVTFDPDLVFVIMPFEGDEMRRTYSTIKDECSKLGLNAVRVDENVGSGLIINEVTDLILRCEFIICDLSRERPNVYYELGYAHGVNMKPSRIFLIAKEGTSIHFDLSPYRIQYYYSSEHLRSLIRQRFAQMVEECRSW
jgi:hypothetical protein